MIDGNGTPLQYPATARQVHMLRCKVHNIYASLYTSSIHVCHWFGGSTHFRQCGGEFFLSGCKRWWWFTLFERPTKQRNILRTGTGVRWATTFELYHRRYILIGTMTMMMVAAAVVIFCGNKATILSMNWRHIKHIQNSSDVPYGTFKFVCHLYISY